MFSVETLQILQQIDIFTIFVNLITPRMSFYFNAAICLRTFMYRTHYGILIKWLMQNKSISNCEMSTTTKYSRKSSLFLTINQEMCFPFNSKAYSTIDTHH
jgi:hypothetical protein